MTPQAGNLPVRDCTSSDNSLTNDEFRRVAELAASEAGLSISDGKKALVQSRLMKRLRATGTSSFGDYLDLLADPANLAERREFVSALTTNVTSFFRENHHFQHFSAHLIPLIRKRLQTSAGRVRIWSAGCSNGQEPFSIAMEILEAIPDAPAGDLLILATDIDRTVLSKAATGRYSNSETAGVSDARLKRHFHIASPDGFRVREEVRNLVRFRELNLHGQWPMRGHFDAIFCRNVMIYFDEPHQRRLWPRFRDSLVTGGFLYLGHSERIHPIEGSGFDSAGVTIYRKS